MKALKKHAVELLENWGYAYTRKSKAKGNNAVYAHSESGEEYTVIFHTRKIPSSESPDEVFKYERIDRLSAAAEEPIIYCYVCHQERDDQFHALAFKIHDAEQIPTYNDQPVEGFHFSVLDMQENQTSSYAFKRFQPSDTGAPKESGLFINGIYEAVLEEIIAAQEKQEGLNCYIQPYKDATIRILQKAAPTPEHPVTLYISTTKQLSQICYTAEIVEWEDKREMSDQRKTALLPHYKKFQPGELEYFSTDTKAVNLLTIRNLKQCKSAHKTSILNKVSDGLSLKPRTRAGGWSEVQVIPDLSDLEAQTQERYETEFRDRFEATSKLSDETLTNAAENADPHPEKVQVISVAFKRNAAVVAATLRRANGICERCNQPAPFKRKSDGTPYLEVHHKIPLSEGGTDTLDNTIALCPNCHRELHHG